MRNVARIWREGLRGRLERRVSTGMLAPQAACLRTPQLRIPTYSNSARRQSLALRPRRPLAVAKCDLTMQPPLRLRRKAKESLHLRHLPAKTQEHTGRRTDAEMNTDRQGARELGT